MTLAPEKTDLDSGRVVAIAGPVVDVEFPPHALPEINHAVEMEVFDGKTGYEWFAEAAGPDVIFTLDVAWAARGKQNTINRALGIEEEVQAEFKAIPLVEGDAFLLTSDGVTRHLADQELEELLGQGLKNLGVRREDVVIATQVYGEMGPGPHGRRASRGHILDSLKASLKRLQTDHIDLYQIHGWDAATPMEETLDALDNLVRRGLVRYIGLSNWAAWQVAKAQGIAERKGSAKIASGPVSTCLSSNSAKRSKNWIRVVDASSRLAG